jgi:hypothetical protein
MSEVTITLTSSTEVEVTGCQGEGKFALDEGAWTSLVAQDNADAVRVVALHSKTPRVLFYTAEGLPDFPVGWTFETIAPGSLRITTPGPAKLVR